MTDERKTSEDSGEPERDLRPEASTDPETGDTARREPSMFDGEEGVKPDMDDTAYKGSSDEETNYTPYVESRRRWSPLRLMFLALGILVVLGLIYVVFFASSKPKGPTLESRLQSQQQVIDQLRVRIEELQGGQDEYLSQATGTRNRLGELASRLADLEQSRQASSLKELPTRVQALSSQIDELSNSVDVRFSATQEKEQSLESSIEEVRKLQASPKASAQQKQVSRPRQTRREPKPPSPPFSVSGVELRGGRSYLAVASGAAGRLSDLRLIGEGQSVGQWRLSSIDGHSAVFAVDGRTVNVPLP